MAQKRGVLFRSRPAVVVAGLALMAVTLAGCTGASAVALPGRSESSTVRASASSGPSASAPVPAGASTGGSSGGAPVPSPAVRTIPGGFLLPNEGEHSTEPDITDWTTNNAVGQVWLLDPCLPTAYPTDRQRGTFRTVRQTGPGLSEARQLAVYPTVEVAAEVLAGFRRVLAACSTGTKNGVSWKWVTKDVPNLGDDGFVAASASGGGGDRIAVTRKGAAVFLAYSGGEYLEAELGSTRSVQQVAQKFVHRLAGA